jgi:hypothetical protein
MKGLALALDNKDHPAHGAIINVPRHRGMRRDAVD